MAKSNGLNMADVKIKNRSAVLELIFRHDGISRKEIAAKLGLTPAAITLIINSLIEEGLVCECGSEQTIKKKGRREVLLSLRSSAYVAVGVLINPDSCHIVCADMDGKILCQEVVGIQDCGCRSESILNRMCDRVLALLDKYQICASYNILGIGIGAIGEVDMERGISVDSYSVWEKNVDVVGFVEKKTGYPTVLSHNICALANGDAFLRKEKHPYRMLFVKYGPGIGAARYRSQDSQSIFNLIPVELGHMVMEPNGLLCVCRSRGCLETISSYSAMMHSLWSLVSPEHTPVIYEKTGGDIDRMNLQIFTESYLAGESPTVSVTDRSMYYFALALRNVIRVLEPAPLALYGELFEVKGIRELLMQKLDRFGITEGVRFTPYSRELEVFGPASMVFSAFIERGANLTTRQ